MEFKFSQLADILPNAIKRFKENWFVGYKYEENKAISFRGKLPSMELISNPNFFRNFVYVNVLFDVASVYGSDVEVNRDVLDEVFKWNEKGGLCIFFSVLLYQLLLEDRVVDKEKMKYIQGYYYHKAREDNPLVKMIFGEHHAGYHAWLAIEGSVIDVSIKQEQECFDFKDKPFILGEVPKGIELVGFEENEETVRKYVDLFLKEAGKSYDEWIRLHKEQAIKVI